MIAFCCCISNVREAPGINGVRVIEAMLGSGLAFCLSVEGRLAKAKTLLTVLSALERYEWTFFSTSSQPFYASLRSTCVTEG